MSDLSISKETTGTVEEVCEKVSEAIKAIGFGVLTRIDFDQKIQEKLNQKINKTVILGACNPKIAYEAYKQSTDMALLIPCNIVVRELDNGKIVVEAIRPTKMLEFLKNFEKSAFVQAAEDDLQKVILAL